MKVAFKGEISSIAIKPGFGNTKIQITVFDNVGIHQLAALMNRTVEIVLDDGQQELPGIQDEAESQETVEPIARVLFG